jgi:hypothetical protein
VNLHSPHHRKKKGKEKKEKEEKRKKKEDKEEKKKEKCGFYLKISFVHYFISFSAHSLWLFFSLFFLAHWFFVAITECRREAAHPRRCIGRLHAPAVHGMA